jgi:DNA topoisomerase VI subunit B
MVLIKERVQLDDICVLMNVISEYVPYKETGTYIVIKLIRRTIEAQYQRARLALRRIGSHRGDGMNRKMRHEKQDKSLLE